ncbi:MAG: EAL domain-containing protein, partial [Pseudomonas sp.]|nr:EAL domain-containing protein [Pseudomonas sp.]
MTIFPSSLTSPQGGCQGCQQSEPLGFDFSFAYQPIVDLRDQSVFAHEALVRGIAGEGALSVLHQVTEENRYRFDQLCRTRAIAGAANLNMQTHLSINFMPNAVY